MNKNTLTFAIIALLLLIGLFALTRPKTTHAPERTNLPPAKESTRSATSSAENPSTTAVLVLKNKQLLSGPETIQVKQGDQVIIKILSDIPEEFHIHGYDKSVALEKDIPATLSFATTTTGRFEYELEQSGITLGALEVLPK